MVQPHPVACACVSPVYSSHRRLRYSAAPCVFANHTSAGIVSMTVRSWRSDVIEWSGWTVHMGRPNHATVWLRHLKDPFGTSARSADVMLRFRHSGRRRWRLMLNPRQESVERWAERLPQSVRRYSTFGGTSACTMRLM